MKRHLSLLSITLLLCGLLSLAASVEAGAVQREAPPLGRYTCTSVAGRAGLTLNELNLITRDRYRSASEPGGVYAYDSGERKIEWLTGPIPRQLVGFYTPKGVDNAGSATIVIRDKREMEEGNERDLWKCTLAAQ